MIDEARLYLLRHGQAADKLASNTAEQDFVRPLTPKGVRQSVAAGKLLRAIAPKFDACYCSPAVRCHQSAVLACAELKGVKPKAKKELLAMSASEAVGLIKDGGCCLLVCHGPELDELIEHLTGRAVHTSKGTLAQIGISDGQGTLEQLLNPKDIASMVRGGAKALEWHWDPGQPRDFHGEFAPGNDEITRVGSGRGAGGDSGARFATPASIRNHPDSTANVYGSTRGGKRAHFRQAKRLQGSHDAIIRSVTAELNRRGLNAQAVHVPMKTAESAQRKVSLKYTSASGKEEWHRVRDLLRGSVNVARETDLDTALEVAQQVAQAAGWRFTGVENRFSTTKRGPTDVGPTEAGYRDVAARLVSPDGKHVAELQLSTAAMAKVKGPAHELYEVMRKKETPPAAKAAAAATMRTMFEGALKKGREPRSHRGHRGAENQRLERLLRQTNTRFTRPAGPESMRRATRGQPKPHLAPRRRARYTISGLVNERSQQLSRR